MGKPIHSERSIQRSIWVRHAGKGTLIIAPCSGVFGWESDMVIVTRALMTHEYEIKISRSDFLNDKKKDKFAHFDRWMRGEKSYHIQGEFYGYEMRVSQPPNYFWYICPKELIQPEEISPNFGLAYLLEGGGILVVKKPKRLHKDKLPIKALQQLCNSMNWKFWHLRNERDDQLEMLKDHPELIVRRYQE